ncbi:MAG: glycosyltransferase family A protein, partial [archaeon]
MKVSVIIPAFNAEKTVRETIKSVLNQSFKEFELIVVNDGSTDKTKKIIEGFKEKTRIINVQHKGISSSRNIGARNAKEEIIAFLDADVTVEKDWLKKLIKPFKEEKDLFGVSGIVRSKSTGSIESDFFCFSIGSSEFQGYNVAFRKKEFLEMKGYNEELRYGEDPELVWRAFNNGMKLKKANALAFHRTYGLIERLKAQKEYAFCDAKVIKKNFPSVFRDPINFLSKAPKNIQYILGFYFITFLSWIAAVIILIIS